MSIWDDIKSTAGALGSAGIAPAGALWDLANMPFDEKDDNFGTVVGSLADRAGDVLSLAMGVGTPLETPIEKTFQAMNWALDNFVNRPIGTLANITSHDTSGAALFDRDSWARAWAQSDDQNAGQALANLFLYNDDEFDPFDYKNPYQERTSKQYPKQAAGISWGANIAGAFLLDPAAVALKGAGVAREAHQYARLSPGERANAMRVLTGEAGNGSLASRVDKWIDWTEGTNKLGRSLSGPEILAGTPELRRYGTDPHVVAGLLADTNRLTDATARRNAKRRILAVAMGDRSQIDRLRAEVQEAPAIADALRNMSKGGVLDLELLGREPGLRTTPMFTKHLEGQLDNINKDGAIDRFIDDWTSRLSLELGTEGTLRNAPGVHRAGNRALLRENNMGKGRALANAHKAIDVRAARLAERGKGTASVFQAGRYSVPLIAVRTLGKPFELYTKAPVAISDSLRQTHYVGVANLDEWGPAATQIEAMQRLAGVATGERMELMNRVFIAKTETEKLRLIEEAESRSVAALAARYNETAGRKLGITIDSAFVREVVKTGSEKRAATMSNLRGRSYAASEMSPTSAAAMDAAQAAADGSPVARRKWTADQVLDDQGIPVHLPLLETQLTNSIPLLDIALADKLMKREYGYLARLSKGWKADAEELDRLYKLKQAGHVGLDRAIRTHAAAMDWAVDSFQRAMRVWKVSVLLRIGYPVRVLMDDHARVWAKMGTRAAMMSELRALGEGLSDVRYNQIDRRMQARRQVAEWTHRRRELLDLRDSEQMAAWPERAERLKQINREIGGRRGTITKLRSRQEAGEDVTEKLARAEQQLADREAARGYLIEQMGDSSPEEIARELDALKTQILAGSKAARGNKRKLGESGVTIDGVELEGAFGGQFGGVMKSAASSGQSFDHLLRGIEDRSVRGVMVGSHRTIGATEPGHLEAWADVLNHQIRSSPVAMHFLRGGDVQSFTKWLRSPEGADLRKRLPHFAYDPEDWAERVQTVLFDYIPTERLREAVVEGRVSAGQLAKFFPEQTARPAVHGRSAADTLGSSAAARGIGSAINSVMRWLSEVPTDRLSRHPYFATMYREHAKEALAIRRAGGQREFSQADLDDITRTARKNALRDVRTTLFDMSAHSHAAHVMRFVSPFAAAHQEALSRWWRIAVDRPQTVRRFSQLFDLPRYAGLVVDENGDRVEPGTLPSADHRIMLQLPSGADVPAEWSQWVLNEASFNLLMPQGPTNPGTGPLVQVPLDWAAQRYADEPAISRVSSIFNPYPPQSAMDSLMPATLKRLSAYTYAETGVDPSLGLGIGTREYNAAFSQELQDQMVAFQLREGREPTKAESDDLMERAGNEATSRMFHRVLWNGFSPAPAQPQSRYAVVQQAWYAIQEQARSEGRDFDWAYDRFRSKYQEAYLPLLASSANNPAGIDSATPAWVASVKAYGPVLQRVDPALTKLVVGAMTHELIEQDASLGEYSQQARNFLRDRPMQTGSDETYYSYDEPSVALEEGMARRGWAKYNALTAALEAEAERLGLPSYEQSPQLVAIRRAAVDQIKAENWAWAEDYGSIDAGKFDSYIADMRQLVQEPVLANDPQRTDIKVLDTYLKVRDLFADYFQASLAAGTGGVESQAQQPARALYTAIVDQLVRSNTMFQAYMYDGIVERDPWLLREPISGEATA
ncbi:MAG: hypothetical protein KAG80_02100 [Nocardioides sp.]|nr:hypothetical protein [Nocardioides sp.]